MKYFFKNIFFLTIIVIFTFSCNNSRVERKIAKINVDIKLERFDIDLLDYSKQLSNDNIVKLSEKYMEFFDIYNLKIIQIGTANSLEYCNNLKLFLNDYTVKEAIKKVNDIFSNTDDLEKEIQNIFKHIIYYYPDYKPPRLVTYVSGFNESIVLTDNFLAIGLDKYLGADCKLYEMLSIQKYLRLEMSPEFIPHDITRAIAEDICFNDTENKTLLSEMMYNAKILYFIKTMQPNISEDKLFKYTAEQLEFCKNNEKIIWTTFVEQKLLFNNDYFEIRKLTQNAPYTTIFGPDSPPRIANWIAYKIIQSYMKNNDISLQELMENNNYQSILQMSQY